MGGGSKMVGGHKFARADGKFCSLSGALVAKKNENALEPLWGALFVCIAVIQRAPAVIKGSLEGTSVLRQLIESQLSETRCKRRNKPARKTARACSRGRESRIKRGPVRESAFSKIRKSQKAWPCARIGVSGDAKACPRRLVGAGSEHVLCMLGAVSERARRAGPIGTATQRFRKD